MAKDINNRIQQLQDEIRKHDRLYYVLNWVVQMTTKETHDMAMEALQCLREAVLKELKKKALLGQYVIINRNGKPHRVLASEALKIAESNLP